MLIFNKKYFIVALLLFAIKITIGLFAHDKIIRPYVGDFLVVILIYCFVKAFINLPVLPAAISVLIFAYFIEFLQYFNIVQKLGLNQSKAARILIGTTFEWSDLLMYAIGIALVLLTEWVVRIRKL